jgi:hypothetical protein
VISSTTPAVFAASALDGAPPAIQSIATWMLATRGVRTVPPKPGNRPSLTSGKPTWAVVDITRKSAASAHSSPPPSANPLIATTLGTRKVSSAVKMRF